MHRYENLDAKHTKGVTLSLSRDIKRANAPMTSEEKLMASFIKYEQFFKKYKFQLIALLIAIVAFVGYIFVDSKLHQSSLKKANEAFLILQAQPDDTQALQQLQQNNEKLYQLFVLNQTLNEGRVDGISNLNATAHIEDVATYHQKLDEGDLSSYQGLYSDLANLVQGYHLLKMGNIDKARVALSKIPQDSELASNVAILNHYMKAD